MCLVQIHIRCADRFFEVLPEEVETAELAVEELISQILMDLSEEEVEVMVDDVTINFWSQTPLGQQYCSIHIQAQCPISAISLSPQKLEYTELLLEERLCNALVEMFGTVNVEAITIRPPLLVA
ncbi:MAG TPA: hypothetical protein VFU49_20290 [Ktedonobacteraceae bacterium]|nr:hypothetical protein [Ktedonobacteraceae bacterium]